MWHRRGFGLRTRAAPHAPSSRHRPYFRLLRSPPAACSQSTPASRREPKVPHTSWRSGTCVPSPSGQVSPGYRQAVKSSAAGRGGASSGKRPRSNLGNLGLHLFLARASSTHGTPCCSDGRGSVVPYSRNGDALSRRRKGEQNLRLASAREHPRRWASICEVSALHDALVCLLRPAGAVGFSSGSCSRSLHMLRHAAGGSLRVFRGGRVQTDGSTC